MDKTRVAATQTLDASVRPRELSIAEKIVTSWKKEREKLEPLAI
jgi:hypothetical protein